MQLSATF